MSRGANVDWPDALAKLDQLAKECAVKGWDSYDGDPLTPEAVATARLIADRACIVPMANGGIEFTFGPNEEISFDVARDGRITSICFDVETNPPRSQETP